MNGKEQKVMHMLSDKLRKEHTLLVQLVNTVAEYEAAAGRFPAYLCKYVRQHQRKRPNCPTCAAIREAKELLERVKNK